LASRAFITIEKQAMILAWVKVTLPDGGTLENDTLSEDIKHKMIAAWLAARGDSLEEQLKLVRELCEHARHQRGPGK
jgi:hypothetical protein